MFCKNVSEFPLCARHGPRCQAYHGKEDWPRLEFLERGWLIWRWHASPCSLTSPEQLRCGKGTRWILCGSRGIRHKLQGCGFLWQHLFTGGECGLGVDGALSLSSRGTNASVGVNDRKQKTAQYPGMPQASVIGTKALHRVFFCLLGQCDRWF